MYARSTAHEHGTPRARRPDHLRPRQPLRTGDRQRRRLGGDRLDARTDAAMSDRTRNISSSAEGEYLGSTYIAETPAERLRERLSQPEAFLSRSDLRELGHPRRAVDAVFRELGKPGGPGIVVFPGYSRPLIRVRDYLELVERSTFRGDRVRPCG